MNEEPSEPKPLSKNQQKRLRREDYLRAKKKAKKEQEKIRKAVVRTEKEAARNSDVPQSKESSSNNPVSRTEKKELEIQEYLSICVKSFSIIIDCSWESKHSEAALRSLSQQIMFCYAINRRSASPCNLILSGVGPLLKSKLEKLHFENWVGVQVYFHDALDTSHSADVSHSDHIHERLNKDKMIYLTSDAEALIDKLDTSLSYIIGGIVDRNSMKGATLKKATELSIPTAKLPVKEHFALSATHVLTVSSMA